MGEEGNDCIVVEVVLWRRRKTFRLFLTKAIEFSYYSI